MAVEVCRELTRLLERDGGVLGSITDRELDHLISMARDNVQAGGPMEIQGRRQGSDRAGRAGSDRLREPAALTTKNAGRS